MYIQQTQIDIDHFMSKEKDFEISCKLHEIPKPVFQENKRTIFENATCFKFTQHAYLLKILIQLIFLITHCFFVFFLSFIKTVFLADDILRLVLLFSV